VNKIRAYALQEQGADDQQSPQARRPERAGDQHRTGSAYRR
jgi:GTP cyclohydrolase II